MAERNLLNTNQTADYLGLSRSTLLRHIKAGLLVPGIKMGPRAIRWRRADLDAHIERCEASSAAQAA